MARLAHPNVIAVHDVGEVDGRVFVAMEFIEGQTLGAWARLPRRNRARAHAPSDAPTPDWPATLEVMLAAGRGLAAAHDQDLVHRDFKPDNVMVGADGRVFVMDFGLVRAARGSARRATRPEPEHPVNDSTLSARPDMHASLASATALESELTRDGALVGTPAYMAPEQLRGDEADTRSDQFAFCVVAWQCLLRARPFAGDTPLAVLFSISQARFNEPPPGNAVPTHVRRVLERGLAAAPDDRWPDMHTLLAALADDPSARRRPWALGIASLGLAVAAALTAILVQPAPAPAPAPCKQAGASMATLWSVARAAEVGEIFARSELVYADETWARAAPLLDAWSVQWVAARRDACEATEVRREQSAELLDLRMACLDRREQRFAALIEVFANADDAVVEKAVEAIEALPALEICGDRSWLTAALRPPEDPELAAAVEGLRARLAKIDALTDGGKAQAALADAEAALTDARVLAWHPTIAEAGVALGRAQQELGSFSDSRAVLEDAFFSARRGGHDEVSVRAAYLLIYSLVVGLGEFETAAAWSEHALAEAERIGRDDLLSQVQAAIGIRHYFAHNFDAAKLAFARSLELAPPGRSIEAASAHINYGTVLIHVDRNDRERAFAELTLGTQMLERRLGPRHPSVATALSNHATVHGRIYEHEQAIELLERALEINEAALGSLHPMTALVELNLAKNLVELGARAPHERAEQLAERALAKHLESFGAEHVMVAESKSTVARARLQLDRPAEALTEIDEAIAIWTAVFGPTHVEVLAARELRARCELALGQRKQALANLESILVAEPDGATRASVNLTLAEALVELEESEARERFDAALAGFEDAELGGEMRRRVNELGERFEPAKPTN